MDGDDSKSAVLEKLAPQMASSVEWTSQMEKMYDSGARIFIEVGPKRALTMFATQILEGRPHLPIMTNHPKQGGIASFLTALAGIYLAGRDLQWPEPTSDELSEAFKAGPIEAHTKSKNAVKTVEKRPTAAKAATSSPVVKTNSDASRAVTEVSVSIEEAITAYVGDCLGPITGYPAKFCSGMVNLRTLLLLK